MSTPASGGRRAPGPSTGPGAAELLQLVVDTPTVEAYLDEVADLAGALTPAIASVGVTVRRSSNALTVATSNSLAAALDEVQYGQGTGPCLDTLRTGEPTRVDDLTGEDRWDDYPAHAVGPGVRSGLALPLTVADVTIGVLNCCGREPGMFVDPLHSRLARFATHAELALAVALRAAQQSDLVEQMHTAMQSRSVIDQAMGIVMARQACTAPEAFALLRSVSQSRNRRIADVAADLIASTTGAAPLPGRFET